MSDNIDYNIASSEQIVADLGDRLRRLRLASNVTQADLAYKAGVGTRTLVRLEGGEGGTIDSFVRVISAMGLRSHLEALLPDPQIRPMERVQLRGRERLRARTPNRPTSKGPFRWGDR
jgi:transcriptional regulator with XRE-family HTH domain